MTLMLSHGNSNFNVRGCKNSVTMITIEEYYRGVTIEETSGKEEYEQWPVVRSFPSGLFCGFFLNFNVTHHLLPPPPILGVPIEEKPVFVRSSYSCLQTL